MSLFLSLLNYKLNDHTSYFSLMLCKRRQVSFILVYFLFRYKGDKDGSKITTVVATTGSLPDRTQEISYTDTKVIGNGSFGVVYQARMCDSSELVAIKKVLQDKRFKVIVVNILFYNASRSAFAFYQNIFQLICVTCFSSMAES